MRRKAECQCPNWYPLVHVVNASFVFRIVFHPQNLRFHVCGGKVIAAKPWSPFSRGTFPILNPGILLSRKPPESRLENGSGY